MIVISTFRENKRTMADCLCDCSSQCIKRLSHLKGGGIRSCGSNCPYKPNNGPHPLLVSANRAFCGAYDDGNLTLEQFYLLSQLNCWYCGTTPANSNIVSACQNDNSPYRSLYLLNYNGLDRIDNNQSHNVDNVVPCCHHCNWAKRDMTPDEFASWLERFHKHQILLAKSA